MIEFTFRHTTLGEWKTTIQLGDGMNGGDAFNAAAAQYKANVFADYRPGHPDVTITIRGV